MIPKFNRSISLPINPRPRAAVGATYHVRSVSLPSQSHPLISNLEEQIRTARSWAAAAGSDGSFAWIETGLSQIEFLHFALNDFLNLSDTKNVLQWEVTSTEHLLDNLLHLVDSYGSLVSVVMAMKQQLFEVQSAFRRCDFALLTSSLKLQRKTEKELCRLVCSLRASNKCLPLSEAISTATQFEIIEVLKEAIGTTTAASVLIFTRVANVSTMTSTMASSSASLAKKTNMEARDLGAFQKLKEFEKCVEIVESGSEKVFRSLVTSRVSLLNIQSDLL